MATTDAKAGFRLPWSSDRSATDDTDNQTTQNAEATTAATEAPEATADTEPTVADVAPTSGAALEQVAEPDQPTETTEAEASVDVETAAPIVDQQPAAGRVPSGRKPSKFLADLTRAMQTAAEESRALALSQLQGEAKTYIEEIHARSTGESADLRRAADDDVASVREWSKAEIARIREETEARISDRKARLETEIEHHAGVIEREIEAVQATVAGFESDMATFFDRLLAEEDPTQFATMAERLPEPPSFSSFLIGSDEAGADEAVQDNAAAEPTGTLVADANPAETPEATAPSDDAPTGDTVATGDATTSDEGSASDTHHSGNGFVSSELIGEGPLSELGSFDGLTGEDGEVDREAAFAAIQAAAEAAASAEVATDAAARAEAVADVAIEIIGSHGEDGDGEADPEADPRFAALRLSPDYDAAEAEALASADASDTEEIPEIGDDALAARLAGLVPDGNARAAVAEAASTQVIVVGLVSVASIASFKRHLGRLPGVQSVGVSSGPEGEFVFAVHHGPDVVLREAIPSLPSFQARVTGTSDGVVNVTAHDPESDN
jgi:hypothetical protein